MLEYYAQVKAVHVCAVLASGSLFATRGLLQQVAPAGRAARWAMAAPVRFTSYAIDTVLLTAALMLVTMLPAAMFANGWLWTKLVLVLAYVAFGTLALKRGRTAHTRRLWFLAALLVFGCILAVARAHHPLGPFHA